MRRVGRTGDSRHLARPENEESPLSAKLKTEIGDSIKLEMFDSQFFSNVNYDNTYSYSALRLRSQLTKPMPMLPNTIAPGAGIAWGWTRNAASRSGLSDP